MDYSPTGIPIIDLQLVIPSTTDNRALAEVANNISAAIKNVGCFYVKNHGIDFSLIDSTLNDLRNFFSQPYDYKIRYSVTKDRPRGYTGFETQNINAYMGHFGFPNDPVERMTFGPLEPISHVTQNHWPDTPITLRKNVENYYAAFNTLAHTLLNAFSVALNCDRDYLYRNCSNGEHLLKANFYPGSTIKKPNQEDRFAAHTDANLFTILVADNIPGALKVRKNDGEWVFADPIPGAFFVNVADVLQRLTNDKWLSTWHKVVWPEKEPTDRISVAFFVGYNDDCLMGPVKEFMEPGEKPKYETMVYKEYQRKFNNRIVVENADAKHGTMVV